MIDEPKVVTTEPQPAAVIHLTIPRSEIQNAMGPGLNELMSTLKAQGITITGVVKEVTPPSRVVSTESWGDPWPVATNILELTESGGQTTVVMTIRYASKKDRDAALGTGMKDGMTIGYERLDEYLGTMT